MLSFLQLISPPKNSTLSTLKPANFNPISNNLFLASPSLSFQKLISSSEEWSWGIGRGEGSSVSNGSERGRRWLCCVKRNAALCRPYFVTSFGSRDGRELTGESLNLLSTHLKKSFSSLRTLGSSGTEEMEMS